MTETLRAPTDLVVVTGLSGSGKSVALRTLEDLGCYCVDNLPSDLLPEFVRSVLQAPNAPNRLAVGIDVRNTAEDLTHLPAALSEVGRLGLQHELIFLDTRDEVLIKRFADTRRRHPLWRGGLRLPQAIALERRLLQPLVAIADRVIDSSDLNVHQLRRLIVTEIGRAARAEFSILIESFGFKRGIPNDADFIFDARCLPNPHWDPSLRPLSGRDHAVRSYFEAQPLVADFYADVAGMVERWLPRFEAADSRQQITIAIGCTGGRHRSVYLAERLGEQLRSSGREQTVVFHRELD